MNGGPLRCSLMITRYLLPAQIFLDYEYMDHNMELFVNLYPTSHVDTESHEAV